MGRGGLTAGGRAGHSPTRTFRAFSARYLWMASVGVDMAQATPGSPTHTQQRGRSKTSSSHWEAPGDRPGCGAGRQGSVGGLVNVHPCASRRKSSGLTGTMAIIIVESKFTQERGITMPPPASDLGTYLLLELRRQVQNTGLERMCPLVLHPRPLPGGHPSRTPSYWHRPGLQGLRGPVGGRHFGFRRPLLH